MDASALSYKVVIIRDMLRLRVVFRESSPISALTCGLCEAAPYPRGTLVDDMVESGSVAFRCCGTGETAGQGFLSLITS